MSASLGHLAKVGERGGLPILRGRLVSMVLETDIAIDPTGEESRKGSQIFAVRLRSAPAATASRSPAQAGLSIGPCAQWHREHRPPIGSRKAHQGLERKRD